MRQNERRRLRNRRIIGSYRSALKQARQALQQADQEDAEKAVRRACSALDKAQIKGIIHRNKVARHKSQLMREYNTTFGE
jgi:small subunit ribosomal protein S20